MAGGAWADHVLNPPSVQPWRTYQEEQAAVEPGGFTRHSDMALALLQPLGIVVPSQRSGD
jgi:hypothetical protein